MNIHYLQHAPFMGLGSIESWVQEKGFQLSGTRLFENEKLPQLETIDWLIILGGPMSVHDSNRFSWLKGEKEYISRAIKHDKVVLGIGLGSQLVAEALGARVLPSRFKEIGWYPVEVFDASNRFNFPQNKLTVFHWHGDTFELPEQARLVSSSRACINQGFRYKDKVVGLQFHLEATGDSIEAMIRHNGNELVPNAFIQSVDSIRNNASHHIPENQEALRLILDHLELMEPIENGELRMENL